MSTATIPLMSTLTLPSRVSGSASAQFPEISPRAKSLAQARTTASRARIRLLLADDHPVVRKGIASFLASHQHLVIVGEAGDGQEALQKARELLPDLLLMDVEMPRMDGLAVTEVLRKELPQVKVLVFSMHRNTEYVLRIIQSGARGYVLKDASPDSIIQAIEAVHAGEAFFSPDVARVALNQFVRGNGEGPDSALLTNREREVLIQIAKGLSNKEIATHLTVGVRTIETHRERIMRKLDIHTVAGLTRFALAKGLISLSEDARF
jgi:two-component system, NarL family, nitrate/nitrite response regulator NarL